MTYHKRIRHWFFSAALGVGLFPLFVLSLNADYDVSRLAEELRKVEVICGEQIDVRNYPEQLDDIPEFKSLKTGVQPLWKQAIANLDAIAPSDTTKVVLFRAFDSLAPESYLALMNKAEDLYEARKISKAVFEAAMSPTGKMAALLVDNYQDDRVRTILRREMVLIPDDPGVVESINKMLSGESKRGLDEWRIRWKDKPSEIVPNVRLEPLAAQTSADNLRGENSAAPQALSHSHGPASNVDSISGERPADNGVGSKAWLVAAAVALIAFLFFRYLSIRHERER